MCFQEPEHGRLRTRSNVAPCRVVDYDAGVRLGEMIEQDMITVPVSGPVRLVVVGAPSCFARHPAPAHPRDLVHHPCINWRAGPGEPPYRWESGEEVVRPSIEREELEEYSTPFPGFYLYYPQRRHASSALRALIDYLLPTRRN